MSFAIIFEQEKRFVNVFLLKLLFPTEFSSCFRHYSLSIPSCMCISPLPPLSLLPQMYQSSVGAPSTMSQSPHYLLSSHTLSLAAFSLSQEQFVSKVCPGDILRCYCLVTHPFHPLFVAIRTLNECLFMRILVALMIGD